MAAWPLLFVLMSLSCSRPALKPEGSTQTDQRQVPFQGGATTATESSTATPAEPGKDPRTESDLPFRDSQDLPAGTLIPVRLKDAISATSDSSETFNAVVDEPVEVEGSTLLPRGAGVEGRVEAAHASQLKRDRGYIRLTLDAIDIAGHQVPVQTASLFVHGEADHAANSDDRAAGGIRLESGRRLTFRLIEPVPIEPASTRSPPSLRR